jgi:hypothetical protein
LHRAHGISSANHQKHIVPHITSHVASTSGSGQSGTFWSRRGCQFPSIRPLDLCLSLFSKTATATVTKWSPTQFPIRTSGSRFVLSCSDYPPWNVTKVKKNQEYTVKRGIKRRLKGIKGKSDAYPNCCTVPKDSSHSPQSPALRFSAFSQFDLRLGPLSSFAFKPQFPTRAGPTTQRPQGGSRRPG